VVLDRVGRGVRRDVRPDQRRLRQTPGLVEYGSLFQRLTITIGFTWLTLLALRRGNAGQQA
jgi:hypothetical protein